MTIDLKHMLKVYNYVNDDKKPKFNLKFLGVFVALVVLGGALIAFAVLRPQAPTPQTSASTKTDHIGLTPAEAASPSAPALLQSRLDAWYAAHPDATEISVQPQTDAIGRVLGYEISYRE